MLLNHLQQVKNVRDDEDFGSCDVLGEPVDEETDHFKSPSEAHDQEELDGDFQLVL